MRHHLRLLAMAALLFGVGRVGQEATAQVAARFASADVELLIKQAVEDRFAADDFPDGNLLIVSNRIALLDEMPRAGLRLSERALPVREGHQFYLISGVAAQTEANNTQKPVTFITVDRPSITEDTAFISLGVDVALPQTPNGFKMCCCNGTGQFGRTGDRWTFVKWSNMSCA